MQNNKLHQWLIVLVIVSLFSTSCSKKNYVAKQEEKEDEAEIYENRNLKYSILMMKMLKPIVTGKSFMKMRMVSGTGNFVMASITWTANMNKTAILLKRKIRKLRKRSKKINNWWKNKPSIKATAAY